MATHLKTLEDLYREAAAENAQPLWPILNNVSPPLPNPQATPHVWKYERLRPFCEEAARLVGTDLAERRVFMLINPQMKAPHTTDTLYAGLQTILPGEVARAHRHTAFALRFIVEGENAYTAVEGEKVIMQRGDMILTPQNEWHDHGNEGTRPMIWMDGLDLPLWRSIPVLFTEHYPEERYPSEESTGPSVHRYPWAEMQTQLDAVSGQVAEVRYRHRDHGGEISRTVGTSAVRLAAGAVTQPVRETASSIYHVYEGSGHSAIDGRQYAWSQGDCFCVPAWKTYTHHADGNGRALLFRMDDRPLITAIGAYCKDAG